MTFLMRINTFLTYLFDLFFCCGLKAAAKYMIRAFSTLMGCKLYEKIKCHRLSPYRPLVQCGKKNKVPSARIISIHRPLARCGKKSKVPTARIISIHRPLARCYIEIHGHSIHWRNLMARTTGALTNHHQFGGGILYHHRLFDCRKSNRWF